MTTIVDAPIRATTLAEAVVRHRQRRDDLLVEAERTLDLAELFNVVGGYPEVVDELLAEARELIAGAERHNIGRAR